MELPVSERAALADSLIESLDEQVDDDAETAWDEEIAQRVGEIDSGAVTLIPWDEARRQLRDRYGH